MKTTRIAARKSGAWLVRYALEQLPVTHTFGIPGVHNTEIYDELAQSERIRPVLVTHEQGAAFMGDAVSRAAQGRVGALVLVPAAGVTHAMSGLGEAFLDGIPLLVITGGIATDTGRAYQLHHIDQQKLVAGVTKGYFKAERHEDIVPSLFAAFRLAVTGFPGPVLVEVPVNVQLAKALIDELPVFEPLPAVPLPPAALLDEAAKLLAEAQRPGLFVGWGAVDATSPLVSIAERLGAPVATTLQGLSAFPGDHPLHVGMGFSAAAVPAAEDAFAACDALLAVGTRFGEIPTGSFSCRVPEALVHVDLDPTVFHRNYPAKVALEGDAQAVLAALDERLASRVAPRPRHELERRIAKKKRAYRDEWYAHESERVNPARFFDALRSRLADDALVVVDDGNHTFLTVELLEVRRARGFISPTDFNCMGYAVPAAIGAKLSAPERQVVAVVGDGAFLMSGLELLTAVSHQAPVAVFVFHDQELSQISQGQEIPYNRKVCTVLGEFSPEGVARAVGAGFVGLARDDELEETMRATFEHLAQGRPVVVDVAIDYSKRTRFTQGVVKAVLRRFPLDQKLRFIGRALWRRVTG